MAEIEAVGTSLSKLTKDKKTMLMIGGGAAVVLGLYTYFQKQNSAASNSPAVSAPDNSDVENQLMQQNASLKSGLQSISDQTNTAITETMQQFESQLSQQEQAYQTSVNNQIGSIIDKVSQINESTNEMITQQNQTNTQLANSISNLTNKISSYSPPVSTPVSTPVSVPSGGTSSSSSSSSGSTIHLANGNTVVYNNGPSGWNEYSPSGQTVASGVAATYGK